MIGTLLNAAGIVAGAAVGLATTRQLSAAHQQALKVVLGVLVVYVGLSTTWQGLNGGFLAMLKQVVIAVLALTLGNLTGKLLRLQKLLNRLGQQAKDRFVQAQSGSSRGFNTAFITCSLLFCATPMAILGAVEDGLRGDFRTLGIKAIVDGLAAMGFVRVFGWGVIASALPVVAYQGTVTLLARFLAPVLQPPGLMDAFQATAGLLIFCIALIILELKRVELADYLPALGFAPLIGWLWR